MTPDVEKIEGWLDTWKGIEKMLWEAGPVFWCLITCLVVGYALKRTPKIPGWAIPWICMVAGSVSFPYWLPADYVVWDSNNPTVYTHMIGAVIGYASTGLHQAVTKLWNRYFPGKVSEVTSIPDNADGK